jgi:esterase/lipase superfamily enzyme
MGKPMVRSQDCELVATAKAPAQHSDQSVIENRPAVYRVWYGTNRSLLNPTNPAMGFADGIDPQGTTHYGECYVTVPRSHQFGSLGSPSWKIWTNPQFEDDHLRLQDIRPVEDTFVFLREVRKELAALAENERQVLIYLPGDDVPFEEAALRSAQIGFDLKIPGLTVFFSWPSYPSESGYLSFRDRIAVSEKQIVNFLTDIAEVTSTEFVHIMTHSMGDEELARSFQRIVAKASFGSDPHFGHMILAAPDIIEVSLSRGPKNSVLACPL